MAKIFSWLCVIAFAVTCGLSFNEQSNAVYGTLIWLELGGFYLLAWVGTFLHWIGAAGDGGEMAWARRGKSFILFLALSIGGLGFLSNTTLGGLVGLVGVIALLVHAVDALVLSGWTHEYDKTHAQKEAAWERRRIAGQSVGQWQVKTYTARPDRDHPYPYTVVEHQRIENGRVVERYTEEEENSALSDGEIYVGEVDQFEVIGKRQEREFEEWKANRGKPERMARR